MTIQVCKVTGSRSLSTGSRCHTFTKRHSYLEVDQFIAINNEDSRITILGTHLVELWKPTIPYALYFIIDNMGQIHYFDGNEIEGQLLSSTDDYWMTPTASTFVFIDYKSLSEFSSFECIYNYFVSRVQTINKTSLINLLCLKFTEISRKFALTIQD